MDNFVRVSRIAKVSLFSGRLARTVDVFVEVRWENGKLSICGVEGPKRNGDAWGSSGQIALCPGPDYTAEPGVDLTRLREVWNRWHLNDARAGCEHQRAAGWDKRPIDSSKPLNTYGLHFPGQEYTTWNMLVWVRPDKHPEGLLMKPCEVCKYPYGSAWLHEDVPEDVLKFLKALPDNRAEYPWRSEG